MSSVLANMWLATVLVLLVVLWMTLSLLIVMGAILWEHVGGIQQPYRLTPAMVRAGYILDHVWHRVGVVCGGLVMALGVLLGHHVRRIQRQSVYASGLLEEVALLLECTWYIIGVVGDNLYQHTVEYGKDVGVAMLILAERLARSPLHVLRGYQETVPNHIHWGLVVVGTTIVLVERLVWLWWHYGALALVGVAVVVAATGFVNRCKVRFQLA